MSCRHLPSVKRCARKLRAFTLIELIAAVTLAAVVTPPIGIALKNSVRFYKICRDERIAERRAETVAALLKMPLRYCALGIPLNSEEYKKSFGGRSAEPFSWNGPVAVTESGTSGRLRVAYAFPEGTRLSEAVKAAESTVSVVMSSAPTASYFDMTLFDKKGSVKNWVTFPDSCPEKSLLTVTYVSGKSLRLQSLTEEDFSIPEGAHLYLFRAVECWSDGEKFYTRDFRTAGNQPRVNGVCGAEFELNEDKTKVTLNLMVRGDDASLSDSPIKNRGCPEDFIKLWDNAPRAYALYAFRYVWNLPNAES